MRNCPILSKPQTIKILYNLFMIIREIQCKQALGKCGFPGGGLAINPYVGCNHSCVYCYARFIKRFTGHKEKWGEFVDARINIAEVLEKELTKKRFWTSQNDGQQVYIGTVTDPYQPIEGKYQLTRKVLETLLNQGSTLCQGGTLTTGLRVSILTKSDLVLRDLDLLKKFKSIDVNFTITSLDEKWIRLTEPFAPTIERRLKAIKELTDHGVTCYVMMGPYWPLFTDVEKLFKKFKETGVKRVFTESFNTYGGNFIGVEEVLKSNYPQLLPKIKEILFDKKKFAEFYTDAKKKVEQLSAKYQIPATIYFGLGHAGKFKD